ncbi:MAG: DUF3298 domain-containing protein [Eubacterium sp.]|nr:DUF3298 domain-containing protein [Eubacterium sp.]
MNYNKKRQIISKALSLVLISGAVIFAGKGGAFSDEACAYDGSVDYTVEREDYSLYGSDGNSYLTSYYDKIVVDPSYEYADKINEVIQEDCYRFYYGSSVESAVDYALSAAEAYGTSEVSYFDYADADVVKNGGGILSIKITTGWFCGGVGNFDTYGLNFNLNTGEVLDIADVYSLSGSEMASYFKRYTLSYINNNPSGLWWDDARDTVNNYSLNDFNYYLEGDNLILCYNTYELGAGAMGSVTVSCPFVNVNLPYNPVDYNEEAEEGITLIINGQTAETDVSPYIENGSTMVPVRVIADALGLSSDYDSSAKTVLLSNDSTAVVLVIGSSKAVVNNSITDLSSPAVIKDGRTMIPLRFCVEAFGAEANWNPDTKTVTITF